MVKVNPPATVALVRRARLEGSHGDIGIDRYTRQHVARQDIVIDIIGLPVDRRGSPGIDPETAGTRLARARRNQIHSVHHPWHNR